MSDGDDAEARYHLWRDAIENEARRVDPDGDHEHGYGPVISYRLGGGNPLDYVATYRRDVPSPHWLYLTIGFSAPLDEDPLPDLAEPPCGFGFELVLRVPRDPSDAATEGPIAYASFLQAVAGYVFRTGNVLRDGDYFDMEGPIAGARALEAFGVVPDVEFEPIVTPFGRIRFSSVVGLTRDELVAVQAWHTGAFVDLAVARGKLDAVRTTDPARTTFLDDPAFRAEVRAGGARDGSRTGRLYMERFTCRERKRLLRAPAIELVFDREPAQMLVAVLPNRIAFGNDLTLIGAGITLRFTPGTATRYERNGDEAVLALDATEAARIASEIERGARTIAVASDPPLDVVIS